MHARAHRALTHLFLVALEQLVDAFLSQQVGLQLVRVRTGPFSGRRVQPIDALFPRLAAGRFLQPLEFLDGALLLEFLLELLEFFPFFERLAFLFPDAFLFSGRTRVSKLESVCEESRRGRWRADLVGERPRVPRCFDSLKRQVNLTSPVQSMSERERVERTLFHVQVAATHVDCLALWLVL